MKYVRLSLLGLVHVMADGYAFCVPPLLTVFISAFGVDPVVSALAAALMTVGHSVLQPVFGLLADRHPGWWLTAAGLVAAGGGVAGIGLTGNYLVALGFIFLAGLGIGAAHPAAVTASARLMPQRRGLAVAIFLFAGTFGLAVGPISATTLVQPAEGVTDLGALRWMVLPAAVVALLVMLLLPRSLTEPPKHVHRPASMGAELRHVLRLVADRRRVLGPLWLTAAVRNLVIIGVVTLLPFHLDPGGRHALEVRAPMAVFVFATGIGGLLYSWLRPRREHVLGDTAALLLMAAPLIVAFPLLRLPAVAGWLSGWPAAGAAIELVLLAVGGLLAAATVPSITTLFQHLVPERENLAATFSMGLAWGAGGLIGPLAVAGIVQLIGGLAGTIAGFAFVAAVCVTGAAVAWRAKAALGKVEAAKPTNAAGAKLTRGRGDAETR